MKKNYLIFLFLIIGASGLFSQEYELVWQEDFNGTELNTDVWNYDTGVGIWNTGANAELQYYQSDNVAVGPDGEGGNALIITAKKEAVNGYQFTSGRIQTRGKVGVQFGKIEARIKLPVLENGLWPAFWMLGTQKGWPASGEIDILEGGHAEGIAAGTQERTMNGALHWEHQGNYAGYGPQWTAPVGASLYEYNTFTLTWTPTRIEMHFNDVATPYFAMDITGADAEEFRDWPHYFILNLAVGGSFPGITNPNNISAPFPAKMYVDYIRVYQQEGVGDLVVTAPAPPPTSDHFGIFTENPSITDRFVIDDIAHSVQIWDGSLFAIEEAPSYDGEDVLAFYAPGSRTWFGFGVNASSGIDLSHYNTGYLKFAMRTSATNNFWVGVGSANETEGRINFNNGSDPYGFQRNGEWQQISIPIADLVGQGLNLSAATNVFMLGGDGAIENILVDDIYYSVSSADVANSALNPDRNAALVLPEYKIEADYYGLFTENPNVTTKLLIDDVDGHIYIWDGTLGAIASSSYDGNDVLAFKSTGAKDWWGFGIHDNKGYDLSHFANGYLSFSVKTSSQETFAVAIEGAAGSQKGVFQFAVGSDPVGFLRDGEWHRVSVPIAPMVAAGLDLSFVGVPFSATSSGTSNSISDIAFDDIILTVSETQPDNPNLSDGDIVDPIVPDTQGWDSWFGDGGAGSVAFSEDYLAAVTISQAGWAAHSVQFFKDNMSIPDGEYRLTFRARADNARSINVNLGKGLDVSPWFVPFMDPARFDLTTDWQEFSLNISKENVEVIGKLVFEMGSIGTGTLATIVYLDDVNFGLAGATTIREDLEDVLEIFPNPAQNTVFVKTVVGKVVNLYNITGVKVASQVALNGEVQFDVSGLSKGLYIVEIDGNTFKLIVK